MSPEKPTILFIPGAWHLPDVFDAVRACLALSGYPTAAPALPSVGAEPPDKRLADDISFVAGELEALCNQGKKVVVVAHSYGGIVGASAVEHLEYAQRQAAGQQGGVIMLVYMSAFVISQGISLLQMFGGNYLPWMHLRGNYCTTSSQNIVFYHDLAPDAQKKWISRLTHTSRAVFEDIVPYEPWHTLPCMYIFCEDDRALPVSMQEDMAARLGDYTSYRCDSSHSPFLSVPGQVAEACQLAAKVGLERSAAV
ncbi:uncharacterized protein N7459_005312 [Penicillium hispanicum]|uniref:uncharacterized protein n=1 Tax=Penicillium hispanicum TaxID=1080232 RepID=UPI002542662E|nr:uncharacterized protein N7459_005312 [Penicillium hispanicum]KAJ5585512.1 hypothetical protein N7459_005312 [Penicillium hispanicum]